MKTRIPWISHDFKASKAWCHAIRQQLCPQAPMKDQGLQKYVSDQLQTENSIALETLVVKYKELFGEKSYKARENYFSRFRKKYGYRSVKLDERNFPGKN